MRKNKKILNIIISLIMVVLLVCNYSYAANENTDVKDKKNTSSQSDNKNESGKSSESRLGDFGIKPHDFKGFKPDKKDYKVEVPTDCDKVEIYAVPKSDKATVVGTGYKNLKDGENDFEITITAENGSKTTYKLTIVRGKSNGTEKDDKEEIKEEVKENSINKNELKDGLNEFTIDGVELSPKFETGIYEYKAEYHGEESELKINAVATDPYFDVDIIGNKELKDGENTITVLVADPDGKNVATYQIVLTKGPALVEEKVDTVAGVKEEELEKMMLIGGGIGALIVIIIIIVIIAKKRDRRLTQEYSVPYSGINSDSDDDNDYWNVRANYKDEKVDTEDNKDFSNDFNNDFNNNFKNSVNNDLSDNDYNDNIVIQEDSDREKMRKEFLDGYNSDNYDDYEEEKPRRKGKHKAKRFK